jgi:hypothetical protein
MTRKFAHTIGMTLLVFTVFSQFASAAVIIEPTGGTVAGKTIGEWSAEWWKWAAPLAPPGDPFTDQTGIAANKNQAGPVFYLAGSENTSSRKFTVPGDKFVLVPLVAGELSQLELGFGKTAAEIKAAAKSQMDQIDSLHATLDGTTITSTILFGHREVSPNFAFVAAAGNQVGISGSGNSSIAVADGYFLMLDPLTPGTHVLNFGGGSTSFGLTINETDTITVPPVPEPSALLLLSLGSLLLLLRRRHCV